MVDPWGLEPWDKFSSADEAAKDFGLYIGQQAIDMNEEFASYIYVSLDENGDVYYTYDIPRNDWPTHDERINSFSISPSKDNALTIDSVAHSHGAYDANTENVKDIFSTPDNVDADRAEHSDTYQSDITDRDYYLVSPNGKLVKYKANSGEYEGELISSDMIVDERIEIHNQLKNTLIFNLIKQSFPKATDADIVEARKSNKDSWLGTLNSLERFR